MDSFTEQLVVRKNTSKEVLKLIVYLLLIFAVPAIFFLLGIFNIGTRYFVIVAVCAFFFAVYGSYYLVTGLYVEYEYAVTNSNITIDKIIAKRSRKRIISVDIKKFNTLRKLNDSDVHDKSYKKFFRASITDVDDDVYAAEMHLEKFNGDCLLLFSPNEKTLDAMKPFLRTNVKAELFKAGAFGKPKSVSKSESPVKAAPKKADLSKTSTVSKPQNDSKSEAKAEKTENGVNKSEKANENAEAKPKHNQKPEDSSSQNSTPKKKKKKNR